MKLKEKHPAQHDERIQQLLLMSLKSEVFIPCQSRNIAKDLRTRFYSCARAHKQHQTSHGESFNKFRSRIYDSHAVMQVRDYDTDIKRYPYTLLVDNRDEYRNNLDLAAIGQLKGEDPTSGPIPQSREFNNLPSRLPPPEPDLPSHELDEFDDSPDRMMEIIHSISNDE
jgi:hypothetical protein